MEDEVTFVKDGKNLAPICPIEAREIIHGKEHAKKFEKLTRPPDEG